MEISRFTRSLAVKTLTEAPLQSTRRSLNALTFQLAPYDPDYVEGLYSDYTCSDDDFYPEAKGKISNSGSSSLSESAISGRGYVVDYDSDMMIEAGSCVGDDDIYPLAQGEISDDSASPPGGHCMMESHGERNDNRANTTRDRQTSSGRFITQAQIRYARCVYLGELPMGPNPGADKIAALWFIINEQKDQINSEKRILERRRDEADASSRRCTDLSSHYSSCILRRSRSHLPPGGDTHNIARHLEEELNEVDILPKTREAAIMATAAYIAANAPNDDEHM
jgi:hypothetical protein